MSAAIRAARRALHTDASSSVQHYDALVVGLGAYGSSALYHLAGAGAKVAGLDRFPPGHDNGSSHGLSRITRLPYFEGPSYVPLVAASLSLFRRLEREAGQELFIRTGSLDAGEGFSAALASVQQHRLRHEVLTGQQVNARFPGFRLPPAMPALFQPDGGILLPEDIVKAHTRLAAERGATLIIGERVVSWRALGQGSVASSSAPPAAAGASATAAGGVEVVTDAGRRLTADALVLAAGPWMGQLVPELRSLAVPERQVVAWFQVADEARRRHKFRPESFPVFIVMESGQEWYGFPEHGHQAGFKIGKYRHLRQDVSDPDGVDRGLFEAADEAALRDAVSRYFPDADGRVLRSSTCFFTNTSDGRFIVDRHPRHPQVVLCSACSGHGFKMSAAVGRAVADMALRSVRAAPSGDADTGLQTSAAQRRRRFFSGGRLSSRSPGAAAALAGEDVADDDSDSDYAVKFEAELSMHRLSHPGRPAAFSAAFAAMS